MHHKRIIDSSYPCVYETWKTEDATWVIQDLRPEDDEAALDILMEDMVNDEVLFRIQKITDDPVSLRELRDFWRECLQQRVSLGCYTEVDGEKMLVALNVCLVGRDGDERTLEFKGEKWKNVYDAVVYVEKLANAYEHMGLDTILHAMGLIVKREYRGHRLGQKILQAREPLCKSQGVKGTATLFSGIGSQKSASRSGFHTIAEVSIRQLSEVGLPYPRDDDRTIKYMAKKYE